MELAGKNIVITGAASGIGAAMSERFAQDGAHVVVADQNIEAAKIVVTSIGGLAIGCDVTSEDDILALVSQCEEHFGPVDMFCSNAGTFYGEPDHAASASNEVWQKNWELHVMSHVYAARAVLPAMIERGSGYFLQMASAAGLLNQIGDAAYSATKHAAVSFAQSLAITHGDQGIKVSVICPQYVATPMLGYSDPAEAQSFVGVLSPQEVAEAVVQGVDVEQFLILPHEQVAGYTVARAQDPDAWLDGMRKLRRKIIRELGNADLAEMHKLI